MRKSSIMYKWINELIMKSNLLKNTEFIAFIITIIVIITLCIVLRTIIKYILGKVFNTISQRIMHSWDDVLYKNKLFHRLSNIIIPIILYTMINTLPVKYNYLNNIAGIISVLVLMLLIDSIISSVDAIYRLHEISKIRPIRGFLQVIRVAMYIICGIIAISYLIGKSPMVLLGSIGAMTAVTSIIFKDAILGFVAGIQLTSNDMIRIGDWIELPKNFANGTVIDISMTTIKVQNFDKTITTIPAYTMVSESFINWRGMETSGGRRIKRAIYIDAFDVQMCNDEMIERLKRIELIKDYLASKLEEIKIYNEENGIDLDEMVNGRRITNIGTFRAYIAEYIKNHSGIHKEMAIMVRQLAPDDKGISLEVYAFTNTTVWAEYEAIQSDIFDHIYSVAKEFGLHIYQKPSGNDVRNAGK